MRINFLDIRFSDTGHHFSSWAHVKKSAIQLSKNVMFSNEVEKVSKI